MYLSEYKVDVIGLTNTINEVISDGDNLYNMYANSQNKDEQSSIKLSMENLINTKTKELVDISETFTTNMEKYAIEVNLFSDKMKGVTKIINDYAYIINATEEDTDKFVEAMIESKNLQSSSSEYLREANEIQNDNILYKKELHRAGTYLADLVSKFAQLLLAKSQ